MGKQNRQQKAIAALLETGTIKEASEVSGISQPTIFRWLQDADFRKAYQEARGRLLEIAIAQIQKICGEAVSVLQSVMHDQEAPFSSRVSAARAILDLAIKGQEVEALRIRIEALEARISK
jgi:hypothetical protein